MPLKRAMAAGYGLLMVFAVGVRAGDDIKIDPAELDTRIPKADPKKYASVRDAKDWVNPYLVIRADGIEIISTALAEGHRTVPAKDLQKTLVGLAVGAWPYGRVAAVQEIGIRSDADAERIEENKEAVKDVLKRLGIQIVWWPSAAPAVADDEAPLDAITNEMRVTFNRIYKVHHGMDPKEIDDAVEALHRDIPRHDPKVFLPLVVPSLMRVAPRDTQTRTLLRRALAKGWLEEEYARACLINAGDTPQPHFKALLKALEAADPKLRTRAVEALGTIDTDIPGPHIKALVAALDDVEAKVKARAAEFLRGTGAAGAVALPKLREMIAKAKADPSDYLRAYGRSQEMPAHVQAYFTIQHIEAALSSRKPAVPKDLDFHRGVPASDLEVELDPGAKVSRSAKGLLLSVKIANKSPEDIRAALPHEWHGGLWPTTGLYASVTAKDTKAPAFVPVYLAGEDLKADAVISIEGGASKEVTLRIDWPGTRSMRARPLIEAPGTYKVQLLLVFEVSGKPQYVTSPLATVELSAKTEMSGPTLKQPH